tara:strand:- start:2097 stop:2495 length:399 start_codon:yes stop_codon:yes gene_type:complete
MGYRSDVYIGVAFENAADLKEVIAVYAIDPRVQQLDLMKEWDVMEDNILLCVIEGTKWYAGYEDVQGIEHMLNLADKFDAERDMPIAYRFVRLGEDEDDMETREEHNGQAESQLIEKLWAGMQLSRKMEVSL